MCKRTYRVLLGIVLGVVLAFSATFLAGCTRPAEEPTPEPAPTSEPTESAEPTPSTSSTEPLPLSELRIELREVASGFEDLLYVTNAGDDSGRLFAVEQGGTIRVVRDGRVSEGTFLDVSSNISAGGERGLLGLAFAEDYESSGRFYVNYTDRNGDTVVARYTADDPASDTPKTGRPQVLLRVEQPYANHNGGCLQFAPDGTLWVGMGDGGAGGDPQERAQNPQQLLGKMLSLDVVGGGTPKPRIVARGLRNPWRYSFDPENDDVWIADVGQNELEEVNRVAWSEIDGANFGWDLYEGSRPFEPRGKGREGLIFPVIEYGRDKGQSVTGGYVYRGTQFPQMAGTYFYADYGSGFIAAAREGDGGKVSSRTLLPDSGTVPASFGVDEAGELYVCDYGGRLMRVVVP